MKNKLLLLLFFTFCCVHSVNAEVLDSDNFNRENSTNLGSNWIEIYPKTAIESEYIRMAESATTGIIWSNQSFSVTRTVSIKYIDLNKSLTNVDWGLYLSTSANDTFDGIYIRFRESDGYLRLYDGTTYIPPSGGNGQQAVENNQIINVSMNDTNVWMYVDSTYIGSWDISVNSGYVGFKTIASGAEWGIDDFAVYSIGEEPEVGPSYNIEIFNFDDISLNTNMLLNLSNYSETLTTIELLYFDTTAGITYCFGYDNFTEISNITETVDNGGVWFNNSVDVVPEGIYRIWEKKEEPSLSGGESSFKPSSTSFTVSESESTTFSISSDQPFMSLDWYLDGELVEIGTMSHTQEWTESGTHSVRFEGDTGLEVLSNTWSVVVSESGSSTISISPSSSVVTPGDTFSLDVYIDPETSLSESQFDLHYSSLASVSSVQEGALFSSEGLSTTFNAGEVDDLASVLRGVSSIIVDSGTISTPGAMATVNMVAGSSSGILELTLSDVTLNNTYSNPAPYTISNATVLVDSAPEFDMIPAILISEGDSILLPINAVDSEGDELTYSCMSLPEGATFDSATATFSWTPQEGDAGSYEVVFRVTDGYLNDSANVAINIAPAASEPSYLPVSTSFTADVDDSTVFNVSFDQSFISCDWYLDGELVESSTTSHMQEWISSGNHTVKFLGAAESGVFSNTWTIDVPYLHPCWDVNEDGIVNILDITLVGMNYGQTYSDTTPRWDVNQDSTVDTQDLSIVRDHFGETVE
ncbi:putative Ig domain-containing protein [Methanolobus sp. ZRKC2]|uniref:putative Ig domain-containing protein n=1 Tax=Methanolobus sp. ZRKC2 TaxID=3125783 RepID=UPI00324F0AC7